MLFSEHHLSHAASAFLCSPFDEAAILTVDGVGEWVTATYGVGKGNDIRLLKQMDFPHSLGLLYSAFTAFLGFEVNEGEYKVMGMAPYGVPRYVDKVWKVVRQNATAPSRWTWTTSASTTPRTRPSTAEFAASVRRPASARAALLHRGHRLSQVLRRRSLRITTSCASEPALCRHRRQHPESDRRTAGGHGQEPPAEDRA